MQFHFLNSIHKIPADQWNSLLGSDYPFLRHEFLAALEDSGSTNKKQGWTPHHLIVEDQNKLLALMPLFIKSHSYGEYVFDWAWADAFHRHGIDYYPKLLNAIPFTPATGPRWAIASGYDKKLLISQMLDTVQKEAIEKGFSSSHWLFTTEADNSYLKRQHFLYRQGCQYHWFNEGYASFDDFLSTFNSRKRKNLKKERRKIEEQNIKLQVLQGREITEEDWQAFYLFYQLTYFKRSGRQGYLTREFFPLLAKAVPENLMMVMAYFNNQRVAAALYFKDETTLYGRYWGCQQEFDQLHFEACYYQGIEFAIQHGLQKFDPGAQGEHKIQRGFRPTTTHSWHWIAEPAFAEAIQRFVNQEAREMEAYQQSACEHLPFKSIDND